MIDTIASSEEYGYIYKRIRITNISSLPLTISFKYNIEVEKKKVKNLLANRHEYKASRTDLDIYGNQIFH
jgi:hypothetical protein